MGFYEAANDEFKIGPQPAAPPCKSCKLKIKNATAAFFSFSNSGCSLRRTRRFGNELRASAAPRLRPANRCAIDPGQKNRTKRLRRSRKFKIHNSRFKIE